MNILHYATHDILGGAAKATYRLHNALRSNGHASHLYVRYKSSKDQDVFGVPQGMLWKSRYDRLKLIVNPIKSKVPKAQYMFNYDHTAYLNYKYIFKETSELIDVIILHWITSFINVNVIKRLYVHYKCPIVWILMDQEPMTGGCHYSFGCVGYTLKCGKCPLLSSDKENDISRRLWEKKKIFLQQLPITFVAGTEWLQNKLMMSSLFKNHNIQRIPIGIDQNIYRPINRNTAREILHIPIGSKVILFGAVLLNDRRKGGEYFLDALHALNNIVEKESKHLRKEDIFVLIAGNETPLNGNIPFAYKSIGYLSDDITLALAYQAANVFVSTSIEDAGPMMIPEAMMCGTPVVSFNVGGAPDIITHTVNGYLSREKDIHDLARGIYTILASERNETDIMNVCRKSAYDLHSFDIVLGKYENLFRSLLGNRRTL